MLFLRGSFNFRLGAVLYAAFAIAGCSEQSSGKHMPLRWCLENDRLTARRADAWSCGTSPDIVVGLSAATDCGSVDTRTLGTGQPATCSLPEALTFVQEHGDPSPGDGSIVVAIVNGDADSMDVDCAARSGTDSANTNILIRHTHGERLRLVGCRVALTSSDQQLPIISVHDSVGPVIIEHLTLRDNKAPGIAVDNNAAPVTLRALSLIENEPGVRIQSLDAKPASVLIEDTVFERNRSGALTVDVAGNGTLIIDVEKNRFRDNQGGAIVMRATGSTMGPPTVAAKTTMLSANIRDNDLINKADGELPQGDAIVINTNRGARVVGTLENNVIRNHSGDGISIAGDGDMGVRIGGTDPALGNIISGTALGDGIELDMDEKGDSYTWSVTIQNNRIGVHRDEEAASTGLGDDGIQVQHRDGAGTLNLTIENNRIANTGSESIRFFSDEDLSGGRDRPVSRINVIGNTLFNSGAEDMIFIRTRDSADACVHIRGNKIADNGSVLFDQGGSSTLTVTHADIAKLAADNGGATVRSDGALVTGTPCPAHIP